MKAQLNVEQGSKILGLSAHTLRAYVSRRRIPLRKIGAGVRNVYEMTTAVKAK